MRVQCRREGEIIQPGVSYNESHLAYYIAILSGVSIMHIRIPKDNPKGFTIHFYSNDVTVDNIWV